MPFFKFGRRRINIFTHALKVKNKHGSPGVADDKWPARVTQPAGYMCATCKLSVSHRETAPTSTVLAKTRGLSPCGILRSDLALSMTYFSMDEFYAITSKVSR